MTVNRERKKIWQEATVLDLEYDSLSESIAKLERYRVLFGDATRIQKQDYEYGDGTYLALMVERDETDAEMNKRIALEERWEAEQAERDLRDFERLKAKLGV
jgi:outer membrane protein TolC